MSISDWVQVYGPSDPEDSFLQPPPLEKQFLISPPCSPPVGWEQPREGQPVVDYDLLAAIAELAPGQDHELQPSTSLTPSIVVQLCQGQEELRNKQRPGGRITQVTQLYCLVHSQQQIRSEVKLTLELSCLKDTAHGSYQEYFLPSTVSSWHKKPPYFYKLIARDRKCS